MRAADSDGRVPTGVPSSFRARHPCVLVLVVLRCRRSAFPVLSSASWRAGSCRRHPIVFFLRQHAYLSSSSLLSRWSPRIGVYHCIRRPLRSIILMGVHHPRRRHRSRRSAVGSPHRPSSAVSTNVSVGACRCRRRPRKDEGWLPLERKPTPPKSALSTERVELATRHLARTGAIAKAARKTA